MACEHRYIRHDADGFWCCDCDEPVVMRTATGHIITVPEMERWISEADEDI